MVPHELLQKVSTWRYCQSWISIWPLECVTIYISSILCDLVKNFACWAYSQKQIPLICYATKMKMWIEVMWSSYKWSIRVDLYVRTIYKWRRIMERFRLMKKKCTCEWFIPHWESYGAKMLKFDVFMSWKFVVLPVSLYLSSSPIM